MDKSCHLVDLDDTGVFVEREWIEVGKRYGGPGFPEAEMLARLAIPNQLSELAKLFRKWGGNLENEMGDWEIWFFKNILSIECDILIKKSNYTDFILLIFALGLSRRSDVLFF